MIMRLPYLTIILLLFTSALTSANRAIRNMAVFTDVQNNSSMQAVVVHGPSRDVFVGGRNALYHFSSNLTLLNKASTGPVLDNPECRPRSSNCTKRLISTDNDMKVLLILGGANESSDNLISCGSVYQGMCRLHPVNNIKVMHRWIGAFNNTKSYVAGRESSVVFVAPGPLDRALSFYTATTYDGRPMSYFPAAVAARKVTATSQELSKNSSSTARPLLVFDKAFTESYKVNYIYGFSYGGFSYFVTTQRTNVLSDAVETRLARVCQQDPTFFSYMEVPLRCHRGVDVYNMATAAHLSQAGLLLKRRLNLDEVTDVLYVSFSMTLPDRGYTPDRTKGSVVCSFPMSQVISSFTNETRDCFNDEPLTHLLQHVVGTKVDCVKRPDIVKDIDDNFCGSSFNPYIEGKSVILGGVRCQVQNHVTSLAVLLQLGKTVAVLGTEDGSVLKVDLSTKKQLYSVPIGKSDNNSTTTKIERSYAFDPSYDNIYLLTGNKVVKFPIGSCSVYTVCGVCLNGDDPLQCGWCGSYCARREECETPALFHGTSCPPIIDSVSPLEGPIEGGTLLTIKGDNFGSSQNGETNSQIEVSIAGQPCSVVKWMRTIVQCRSAPVRGAVSGPVMVKVQDFSWSGVQFDMNGTTSSASNFSYLVPKLYGVYPAYGPASGGTNITLLGEHMNIGAKHVINVAGVPCKTFRVFPNNSWCITSEWSGKFSDNPRGPIELVIDDSVVEPEAFVGNESIRSLVKKEFEYRPNPNITGISPHVTTVSGITNVTVTGTHLNSVANPKIVVLVTSPLTGQKMEIQKNCDIMDKEGTKMICPTPSIKYSGLHEPTEVAPLIAHMAFIMDGSIELRELPLRNRNLSLLLYYPDPVYLPFEGTDVEVNSESHELEIKGKYLKQAQSPSDVRVLINGQVFCNVTAIEKESVFCLLPPRAMNDSRHSIEVFVGSLYYELGSVKFVPKLPDGAHFNTFRTVAGVIGTILIVACGAIALFYVCKEFRRRRLKNLRYIAAYTSGTENGTVSASRRGPEVNDYGDLQGNCAARRPSAAPSCRAASAISEIPISVDEETISLLQSENILVQRDFLSLGEVIGEGYFGRVYRGHLSLPEKEYSIEVAVKTLHNSSAAVEQNIEAFLQEGLMMKDFHHHNVLTLIGVCFETGGNPMVIIPYMKHGDLLSYIRSEVQSPTVKELLTFGVQIASGMKYLSELKFVHRDLAARNCMLDADLTVKVADFGLSRDIYEREYYSSDNKKKLPVKWMAIESMEKGTYNTKTDVWSYGVVMWELLTRGVTPYPDVDNWDILPYLKSGRRLPQPSYCPDMLYSIMLKCWSVDPNERPTFGDLERDVHGVIKKLEMKHKQERVGLDVTYVNCPPISSNGPSTSSNSRLLVA